MTEREQICELIAEYALLLDADDIDGCPAVHRDSGTRCSAKTLLLGPEKVRKMFRLRPAKPP